MQEIKCPSCGKAFTIDESGYADLVKQVRDGEFEKQLKRELGNSQLLFQQEQQIAVSQKDLEIEGLKSVIANQELSQKLSIAEALEQVTRERDSLKIGVDAAARERELAEMKMKDHYTVQLKDREQEIERLVAFRTALSTKMVGESLEQHCQTEFDKIRASAFPRAQFGKDNKATGDFETGRTKGDFIFRDFSESDNIEFVSIMFEMKNESETTKEGQKNESFLEKLDADRNKKNCEYAVLVSVLEPDSELYNMGIVDVSHLYPKMYVVRPTFFIPMITLLRNAATSSIQTRAELVRIKEQNLDIERFETDLGRFRADMEKSLGYADANFKKAIAEIDKSIKALESTKKLLQTTYDQLMTSNNKAQRLTIRELTKGNPTLAAKFAEIEKGKSHDSEDD